MPIYEYRCDACGHLFEVIQKFADAPLDTCPKCQGVLRKLLSSPAIQFKGSGWYITDYARKDGANAKRQGEDGGQPAASTSAGDSGTASASAPASSPTSKTTDAGSSS